MQTEITNEWFYEQSPAEVWAYLTEADLIALWLMPNNFQPVQGYEFEFRIPPIPSLALDGIMYCKILEITPFQKLTYTWKAGSGDGAFSLDTVVEWTLEQDGTGTRLLLKQTGFKESNFSIFTSMTKGWNSNIQKMITHINAKQNGSTNP